MESVLKIFPSKCYNTHSSVVLALFVAIGVVLVAITSDYESRSSLECDPNKSFTSTLSKLKYVETQCLLKYGQEFLPSLPLNGQIVISFGLVVILSVVYGYLVKRRVDIFSNNPNTTTNEGVEESQPLCRVSSAEPARYQGCNRYFVFMAYIIHLIVGRIIPPTIFSAFLLTYSNFPTHFKCPLPNVKATTSTFNENVTLSTTNSLFVDCIYSIGEKKQQVVVGFITINFLVDAVTLVEIVYLLWSAWKRPTFHTDQEFISVYLLRKRTKTILEIPEIYQMIRKNQFKNLFTVSHGFREKQNMDEIYINVIIQDGREHDNYSRREFMKGRHEIYDIQLEKPLGAKVLESTAELFQAAKAGEEPPRTVLVVGRPGIGKTLLTRKVFQEWQQDKIYEFWHEKIVLLILFRDFNKKDEKTSLQDMLRQAHGLSESMPSQLNNMSIYEYVFQKQSDTILVFDGLDELSIDDDCLTDEKIINSPAELAHIYLIFKQLVKGKLLPGATVLTTSRPTAERSYKNLDFDRKVEISGFGEKEIKEYVEKFCANDTQKSSEMWNIIKDSPELISFCYIPVNCQMVCLTLYEIIDFGEQVENQSYSKIPKTMTELYQRAIRILLFKHNAKYRYKPVPKDYLTAKLPELLQNDLGKLKEIAKQGMQNNQLVFEFDSSDEFMHGLADSGVFNQLEDQNQFVFSFLTIQEFLAAHYLVDDIENLESFLSTHIDNPKWHLVIQFVAGLLGDKMKELRSTEHEDSEIIKGICKRFQDWMPKERRIDKRNDKSLFVIKIVWEMQEDRVMKMISSLTSEDDDETFTLKDINIASASTALFKFLSCIKNLKQLQIKDCTITNVAIRELAEFLKKDDHGLESEKCELTELYVSGNRLTAEAAKYLSHALKSDNCKLTKLNVNGNDFKAEGAKYLGEALNCVNCKLTELYVYGNGIKAEGAKYLSDALKSDNCKLTKLDVSSNGLTAKNAKDLGDALESDNCELTTLYVNNNSLTDNGAKDLSDVLMSDKCKLTELDVSYNSLTAEGAKYLSDALKSDNCKLTKLDVSGNGITAEGAKYLSDALKSDNCELTELDVSGNRLTAGAAEYLSDALMSGSCKLNKLNVNGNGLKAKGAKYLSDALTSDKCKLTELNVNDNGLKAEGAKYLGDALTSNNCELTKLYISGNGLTAQDAKYLSDALKSDNCCLTKLNIRVNNLTDKGAKYLSDALESDDCKLTKLDVSYNGLTAQGAKYLSDALKSDNCKLTKLNASGNGLTDKGAKYLEDALKSSNCKLTELDVSKHGLIAEGTRYLSDALKSNKCKLTELDVSGNHLTAEDVKYLSDAKSDNCYLIY